MNIKAEWSELIQAGPWVESEEFETLLTQQNLSVADAKIARDLHNQGFAVLEERVHDSLIDRIVKDTDLLYLPNIPDGARSRSRCMDAWKESGAVRELALLPEILRILKILYGREAFPFQTLNFLNGSEQKTHSDTIHFNSLPVRYMCGAWVALEDITQENGPLHYYAQSNRLQDYDLFDLGLNPNTAGHNQGYGGYEEAVALLMKQKGLTKKTFTVKKGTIGIWAANLFHGGTPILKPGLTRRSQVTHYFFDDCLYYSPVFSNRRAGELFLNDFDIKLNIKTLKPIRPSLNGTTVAFETSLNGCVRVNLNPATVPWSLKTLERKVRQIKARWAVPYRRIKMNWLRLNRK